MERLLLARHAESAYSARGIVNGDPTVNVGLTPKGEQQALELQRELADEPLDLCVVSSFPRCNRTAEIVLFGREVWIVEMKDFDEPRYGRLFEGRELELYQKWAWTKGSRDEPSEGESRLSAIDRYSRAYHDLLHRPGGTILAVVHALPIAYLMLALKGEPPRQRVDLPVEYAKPITVLPEDLARALKVIDRWRAAPDW
ncbi:MAG: histidine phosphatase family protein [Actinobacteria bacterium]|nr:histidine phosphatase family protein [Actinomycetota bacterium]